MRIRENVPISELTTMRLGGDARYVFEVDELADLPKAYEFAKERNLPTWIMGSGANTIGKDAGFDGVIILNRLRGIEVISQTADEVVIRAMGGEIWDDLVEFACQRGYSGVEAMSKIPGTVGAAPVQNIGAYGQDMSQVIENVEVFDTRGTDVSDANVSDANVSDADASDADALKILGKSELEMSYRSTIFNTGKDAGRYFIVAVTLVLENEPTLEPPFYASLQKYVEEHNITDYSPISIRNCVSHIRANKLPDPDKIPSAGSFFKNIFLTDGQAEKAEKRGIKVWKRPDGKKMINSGFLIENAGLKGREFYGFRVSDKAALILINESAKSYVDLEKARSEIRKIVFEKYGFELEQEPVEIP